MHTEKAKSSPSHLPAARHCRRIEPDAEFERWLAKYTPVERAIMEERERRLAAAEKRRERRSRAFGDECEATEGLAKALRRKDGATKHTRGGKCPLGGKAWSEGTSSHAEGGGEALVRIGNTNLHVLDGSLISVLLSAAGVQCTREVDSLRHRLKRPLYYERENARRRALAAERRKTGRRTTTNRCPTREEVLDAWTHAKDSREAMLRFGGIMEDLECYVDNSLRFGRGGGIVGRASGIKGWLQTNVPALYKKYATIMRWKAAAKKLRQVVGLGDPTPVSAILVPRDACADTDARGDRREVESLNEIMLRTKSYSAAVARVSARDAGEPARSKASRAENEGRAMDVESLRARAVYLEAMEGVPDNATRTIARLDELLDPERVEDATMLKAWRERYENEITLRTKSRWGKRLFKRTG